MSAATGVSLTRTLNPGTGYAVHVHAKNWISCCSTRSGLRRAHSLQDTEVLGIDFGADGVSARVPPADGSESHLPADYVVDASGRDTLLGTALRLKRKDRHHQSAALFAHFAGVERRAGEDAGNISIYRFPAGWVWMIPLPGDCMRSGGVAIRNTCGSVAAAMRISARHPAAHPGARDRIKAARIVAIWHATGNYSTAAAG